jgi:hypothetical protein
MWKSTQQTELDRLDAAHLAVGGVGPGRRTATQQINDAYIVLLAAHFQQFCRDLHMEAARYLANSAPHMRDMVHESLVRGRRLDRGNAAPAALGADFDRLGMKLWSLVEARDRRNGRRRRRLDQLNIWRNAVAHQDFRFGPHEMVTLAGTGRTLAFVHDCRAACDTLARQLDAVVGQHLQAITGRKPW